MLRSKIVTVEGLGAVEIRELTYIEAEPIFDAQNGNLGKLLIKASLYIDGKKAFDDPELSLSNGNKLFALVDEVLEINGMGKQKKP